MFNARPRGAGIVMGGNRQPRPPVPPPLPPVGLLPPPIAIWTDDTLRAFGWQSKKVAQGKIAVEITRSLNAMDRETFPTGQAAILEKKEKGDTTFDAYIAALKRCEQGDRDMDGAVANLKTRAQAYLDAYNDFNIVKQKLNTTKKKACEETLRDVADLEQRRNGIAQGLDQLGPPPWNSRTEMQAASLKASADLDSVSGRSAKILEGGGVNKAFWIERGVGSQNDRPAKTFIFKPQVNVQPDIQGFPHGCEASREAMTGRAAEMLSSMSGIEFAMPNTQVVSLTEGQLPPGSLTGVPVARNGQQIKGSLQEFAPTDGELRQGSVSTRRKVTPESCQKIAMLDTVTLNCDRHAGNLLVKPGANQTVDIVPIDHGLTFPPAASLGVLAENLGSEKNTLLKMPGAYEDFTPAMLTAIASLEPDAMRGAMGKEKTDIEAVHPETQGKITDECLDISRRATMFLQLAAPTLPPAVVQVALGQNAEQLLDPNIDDNTFRQRAALVIQDALAQKDATREYFLLTDEERMAMRARLKVNGWPERNGALNERWMLANLTLALQLYKADVLNPATMQAVEDRVGAQARDLRLQGGQTLFDVAKWARNQVPNGAGVELIDDNARNELRAMRLQFPQETVDPDGPATLAVVLTLLNWRSFVAKGGSAALDRAIATLRCAPQDEVIIRRQLINAVNALTEAEGAGLAAPNLAPDAGGQRAKEMTLDYVQRVVQRLPPGRQNQLQQEVARLRQIVTTNPFAPPDPNALQREIDTLLDTAVDQLREILIARAPVVENQLLRGIVGNDNEDIYRETIQNTIAGIQTSVRSGNVVAAAEELERLVARQWP